VEEPLGPVPDARQRGLELIAVGVLPTGLLDYLGPELDACFGTRSFIGPPLQLREEWIEPETDQYRSEKLVDALLDRAEALGTDPTELWSLGVISADLTAPGRKYVFGEATIGGPCAVVSIARLRRWGPFSARGLRPRLLAEAIHELGHLVGLPHCHRQGCVMRPVERVGEADRRGCAFCEVCGSVVGTAGCLSPSRALR
jgi:archaemetzincin